MLKTAGFMVYGYNNFTESGYALSSKNFTEDLTQINCQGRSFIVTGANSGLGKSVSTFLARSQGIVHMICRDEERGKVALQEIKQQTNSDSLHLHICDISEQKEIHQFAEKFKSDFGKLDVLVNNAGVMLRKQQTTSEGYDKVLATNTISNFLLTNLLLPLLEQSTDPRVVFVSSAGAFLERLAIGTDYTASPYNAEANYAKTKRHQISLCEQFAKLYPKIGFYSVHPGWSDTPGVISSMPEFYELLRENLRTADHGADSINWLCVAKIDRKLSGTFFRDRKEELKHLPLADTQQNDTNGHLRALWSWLASITNVGTFDVDIKNVVEDMKSKVVLSKHSTGIFSLSKIDSFKGTEIVMQLPYESLEQRMLICQMILDSGYIYDVFSKVIVPYVVFHQENFYNWGYVPTDEELSEMINDEWLNRYISEMDNIEGWHIERETSQYKVFQKSNNHNGLRPTLVHFTTKATIDQLLHVLDTCFLEKHKEWNTSFDYGVVLKKISDSLAIDYLRYTPHLIDPRDFVVLRRITKLKDGRVVIAERTINHGRFPLSDSIRCEIIYQVRIFKREEDHTFIASVNLTDVKGLIPISIVNNSNIEIATDEISKVCKVALR